MPSLAGNLNPSRPSKIAEEFTQSPQRGKAATERAGVTAEYSKYTETGHGNTLHFSEYPAYFADFAVATLINCSEHGSIQEPTKMLLENVSKNAGDGFTQGPKGNRQNHG